MALLVVGRCSACFEVQNLNHFLTSCHHRQNSLKKNTTTSSDAILRTCRSFSCYLHFSISRHLRAYRLKTMNLGHQYKSPLGPNLSPVHCPPPFTPPSSYPHTCALYKSPYHKRVYIIHFSYILYISYLLYVLLDFWKINNKLIIFRNINLLFFY